MTYGYLFMLFLYAVILFLPPSPSYTSTLSSTKPTAAPDVAIVCGRPCPILLLFFVLFVLLSSSAPDAAWKEGRLLDERGA